MLNAFKFFVALTVVLFISDVDANSFQDGKNAERNGNYKAAFDIWLPLSQNGDASAQTGLAFLYKHGQGVKRDMDQAINWFKEAAAGGNADAQNIMGLFYYSGKGVKQDFSVAAKYYLMAAEQGHVFGQSILGLKYANGEGVLENDKTAVKWYTKAAEQGDVNKAEQGDVKLCDIALQTNGFSFFD